MGEKRTRKTLRTCRKRCETVRLLPVLAQVLSDEYIVSTWIYSISCLPQNFQKATKCRAHL